MVICGVYRPLLILLVILPFQRNVPKPDQLYYNLQVDGPFNSTTYDNEGTKEKWIEN